LDELSKPQHDALEYGALLKESLPTGHGRSITRTFSRASKRSGRRGKDFLRLAFVLAVAPISSGFLHELFEAINVKKAIRETVLEALDQADSLSLCEKAEQDSRRVHTLISRVVRFKFRNDDRIEQLRGIVIADMPFRNPTYGIEQKNHATHQFSLTRRSVYALAWAYPYGIL
jgi:hypothetical protein